MDVSKAIVAHLGGALGVPASTEMPERMALPRVTVVRTGGGGDRFREEARYAIHCWAESESAAYQLALRMDDAMYDLDGADDNIALVVQNSLYSNIYPDGTRRWTGVYIITSNR